MSLIYLTGMLSLVLAAILFVGRLDVWLQRPINQPFEKRGCFYRHDEKRFLGFLVLAVGREYLIMSKVSVSDILAVRPGIRATAKAPARLLLRNQKVDYLLCDRDSANIICAIDLFDRDTINPKCLNHWIARDRLFRSVGLPWIRVPVRRSYQVPALKKLIHDTLRQQETEVHNR